MRVLLDECLPRTLRRDLPGHLVRTAQESGLAGLSNGTLIRRADMSFDAFITIDQRLMMQSIPAGTQLRLVLLRAINNRARTLRPLMPRVLEALVTLSPGEQCFIGDPPGTSS